MRPASTAVANCGSWWDIALPVVRPMIGAYTLVSFLSAWNSFLWPQIVLQSESKYTLPLGLNGLTGLPEYQHNYGIVMAATLVSILPVAMFSSPCNAISSAACRPARSKDNPPMPNLFSGGARRRRVRFPRPVTPRLPPPHPIPRHGALSISCEKPDAVYRIGQTIRWHIRWNGPDDIASARYSLESGGRTEIEKSGLAFIKATAAITARLDQPNTILAIVTVDTPDGTEYRAVGGAVADPDKILPAAPPPADFHAFWAAKIPELQAIPPNPVLTPVNSEKPDVDYWKITMDNIRGRHIQGQIARPKSGENSPPS